MVGSKTGRREGAPMMKEFREFILRGNAVDLAIGVILGAAFGAVVNSLVNDVLMPPIGKVVGGVDFSSLFVVLGGGEYPSLAAAKAAGAATINYGLFLNAIVNLLIIGSVLFVVVKAMNRLRREQPAPAPAPTEKACAFCTLAIPIRARRCPHCTAEQAK
jgi:large conductance mechanosensitive channel